MESRPDPAPAALALDKRIPVAAGLGGGSADAAATLVLASARFGISAEERAGIAPALGADVPFCLVGGTALMEGYGERLTPLPLLAGFWLAVVVPPFEISTAAAYRRWDDLDGPEGPAVRGGDLPPSCAPSSPWPTTWCPLPGRWPPAWGTGRPTCSAAGAGRC